MTEETSKRATVYFEPALHDAIRLNAAHTHRSVSDIVNDAVRLAPDSLCLPSRSVIDVTSIEAANNAVWYTRVRA